jgi:hypothetical protein
MLWGGAVISEDRRMMSFPCAWRFTRTEQAPAIVIEQTSRPDSMVPFERIPPSRNVPKATLKCRDTVREIPDRQARSLLFFVAWSLLRYQ